MTEEKKKIRKEAAAENKPDSTAILRNMMNMMKAKVTKMMMIRTMMMLMRMGRANLTTK